MGEANVEAGHRICRGGKRLTGRSLHLLHEHISRRTGHSLTLVVGDDCVVGPNLGVAEVGVGLEGDVAGEGGEGQGHASGHGGVDVVDDEQIGPVAEREVDAHLVVGQRGGGERDAGIAAVEEGEGQVEGEGGDGLADGVLTSEIVEVADHVVVAVALSGGHSEGAPEVEVVVVEASGDEVVEGDAALADDVVHEVARPAQAAVDAELVVGSQGDGGRGQTQPSLEQIVTGAGNRHGPLLVESRLAGGAAKNHGYLCEPR